MNDIGNDFLKKILGPNFKKQLILKKNEKRNKVKVFKGSFEDKLLFF